MVKKLWSGDLYIDYGQFYMDIPMDEYVDGDDSPLIETSFVDQNNGVCGVSHKGKVFFLVGHQYAPVKLTVELHGSEPSVNDEFGDVVEAPFTAMSDNLHICEWGDDATYNLGLPRGEYIIRYSIKGMDDEYVDEDDECEKPIEGQEYLVQIWSGSMDGDKVLKCMSDSGKYWHSELGRTVA